MEIGSPCIVMEHALVRGRVGHPTTLGDNVLVGPHAHVNGALVAENAFLATGASVFPGARIGARAEVRIRGVVHVNSALPPDVTVPIGWVAVGNPAEIFPPEAHDEIWAIQEGLDFPETVFGRTSGRPSCRRRWRATPSASGATAATGSSRTRDRVPRRTVSRRPWPPPLAVGRGLLSLVAPAAEPRWPPPTAE